MSTVQGQAVARVDSPVGMEFVADQKTMGWPDLGEAESAAMTAAHSARVARAAVVVAGSSFAAVAAAYCVAASAEPVVLAHVVVVPEGARR